MQRENPSLKYLSPKQLLNIKADQLVSVEPWEAAAAG